METMKLVFGIIAGLSVSAFCVCMIIDTGLFKTKPEQQLEKAAMELHTPELTYEQMLAEGWEPDTESQNCLVRKGRLPQFYYRAIFSHVALIGEEPHRPHLQIAEMYSNGDQLKLFHGYCPSVNELRIVCKLVGIEK